MKKNILTLILFITVAFSFSQTYQTGTLTLTFNDPSRTGGFGSGGGAGRQIQTEIYYPATAAGSNVAVATGSFPVVVIGHGFVMTWNSYDNIYSALSKRGYIVALPRTEGGFSPSHPEFGLDIALVGNKMLQLNSSNTLAPIFTGKVDQKLALAGHSMGGGSSFLAAQNNPSITCLFNFAAAQTNPASSLAAKQVTVPTLIIGGQSDCVAPPNTNQDKMWDSTASSKKFEVVIKNLTHCDFGNGSNTNCVLGQNSSGCGNTVNNSTALNLYMNFVNPFLDFNLKGICSEGTRFMDSLNTSQVIFSKKQLGSLACIPTGINANRSFSDLIVFPNPATDMITLKNLKTNQVQVKLISANGLIISPNVNRRDNELEINLKDLEKGLYILQVNGNESPAFYKLIKE